MKIVKVKAAAVEAVEVEIEVDAAVEIGIQKNVSMAVTEGHKGTGYGVHALGV